MLDTEEGENKDFFLLPRQKDRAGMDVQQVRVIKDRGRYVLQVRLMKDRGG